MVFSSIPVYLDPPNWHQHQQQNQHEANITNNPQLRPPLPPQEQAPVADRADQLAKISPPEIALKCPRCESTDTKFCYFNNYSLSQPRHFCKTCKRYWTRGGALRNVPVGGGCRINKKNNKRKSTRSKSPSSNDNKHSSSLSNSTSTHGNPSGITSNPPFMMASNYLQNMSHYGMGNIISNNQIGVDHQWRLQQFPNFLNGFDQSTNSYPFQSESTVEAPYGFVGDIALNSRVTHELQPAKLEDLNLSRSHTHMSVSENNQYYSWREY